MKRLLCRVVGVALVLLLGSPIHADDGDAIVTHNVNLRRDPSAANPPICLLIPPQQVRLLSTAKTAGYFHVKTGDGKKGWVWVPTST